MDAWLCRGCTGFDANRALRYQRVDWSEYAVVQITAKDILDLADNDKAVIPSPSTGKLAAMTAVDMTATLTPAGIGSEYPASGMVRIGRELMTLTRSGDVLTLTRAQDGTGCGDTYGA